LAALFLLLSTALTAFAGIFVEHQPSIATAPHFIRFSFWQSAPSTPSLAVWAILTVIGILRLCS
jgi:hypothetical protein